MKQAKVQKNRAKPMHPCTALGILCLNSLVFVQPIFLQNLLCLGPKKAFLIGFLLVLPLLCLLIKERFFLKSMLKALLKLNLFVILVIFFMIFTQSMQECLLLFIRFNLLMSFSLLLFYKQDIFYLSYATWFVPKFSTLIFFTLSFFTKLDALRCKKLTSLHLRMNKARLLPRLKGYGYLITSLIINAQDLAHFMNQNLQLRGFKGILPRFKLYTFCLQDLQFITLSFIQGIICLLYLT